MLSGDASRVFAPSNSVTSAKDTDSSSGSNDLLNISSCSVRFTDFDSELISESLTPKAFGNDSKSGTDLASIQTRTNASFIPACSYSSSQSTLNSITFDDEHDHEKHENVTAGLCYLVSGATMTSGYLASNNQTMIQQDNDDDNIDSHISPENMFPTYVSYGTENRKEDDGKEYQGLLKERGRFLHKMALNKSHRETHSKIEFYCTLCKKKSKQNPFIPFLKTFPLYIEPHRVLLLIPQ